VIGGQPIFSSQDHAEWLLDTTHNGGSGQPRLVLAVPSDNGEVSYVQSIASGAGIYEVAFHVGPGTKSGSDTTPYGRISWISS